jgi:hypothetical protein
MSRSATYRGQIRCSGTTKVEDEPPKKDGSKINQILGIRGGSAEQVSPIKMVCPTGFWIGERVCQYFYYLTALPIPLFVECLLCAMVWVYLVTIDN